MLIFLNLIISFSGLRMFSYSVLKFRTYLSAEFQ